MLGKHGGWRNAAHPGARRGPLTAQQQVHARPTFKVGNVRENPGRGVVRPVLLSERSLWEERGSSKNLCRSKDLQPIFPCSASISEVTLFAGATAWHEPRDTEQKNTTREPTAQPSRSASVESAPAGWIAKGKTRLDVKAFHQISCTRQKSTAGIRDHCWAALPSWKLLV